MTLTDIPTEQTTAATDAALALLAAGCAMYVRAVAARDRWKANLWSALFALLALGGALGAVAHGVDMPGRLSGAVWNVLYASIALSVGLFVAGAAHDLWGRPADRAVLLVGVAAVALPGRGLSARAAGFWAFIAYEVAAMIVSLCIYGYLAVRGRQAGALRVAAGIVVTLVAAGVQATGTARITIVWPFDHNGLFHLVQMIGLVLVAWGVRGTRPAAPGGGPVG